MNAIINKAEKKAISALMKEIKRREAYRSLENPRAKRLLKLWFVKEFWRRVHELTAKAAIEDVFPDDLHSLSSSFAIHCKGGCTVKKTSAWTEIDLLFERALMEYYAQKKSEEILTMTAMSLIQDLIGDENISFEVRQQKNGRLCFTIKRWASWLPNKVFRTTFETLREDFVKAYNEFKAQRVRYYFQ